MKQMKAQWLVLLPLFVFCFFANNGAAAAAAAPQLPGVALFNNKDGKIMSTTEWRDIDFGWHSIIGGRKRPARVLALEASLTVRGGEAPKVPEARRADDLFLIPYHYGTLGNTAGTGAGSCPLHHYEGYVLLRFRGGWEGDFSAILWHDSTMNTNVRVAVEHFRSIANNESIVFPFQGNGPYVPAPASERLTRRYELAESCSDFTDECFQGRYMTYTTSFKEIPLDIFTGRMVFYVGLAGAWCGPWTLRLQNVMPHDSSTDVDIVMVLVDTREGFQWVRWLTSTLPGNLFVIALCVMWAISFVVGLKELGMRSSGATVPNGPYVTVLYARDEMEDQHCGFLQRYVLALQETLWKIVSLLLVARRSLSERFSRRSWRRWTVDHMQVSTDDVGEGDAVSNGIARELQVHSLVVSDDNSGDGKDERGGCGGKRNKDAAEAEAEADADASAEDDAEFFCRICRCTKPAGDLFSPCACDGSAKYVHRSCLERWRAMTSNAEHRRVCAECKSPYILVLERVPTLPDGSLGSPVCVPAFYTFASRTALLLLFALQLWLGGYYLKICMYLFTGMDEGVIWSAAHLYHWVLGLYYILALCLNMCALERALCNFRESWQQLLLILLSIGALEIPLSYAGQIVLSWLLNRMWSVEVSYSLGIVVMFVIYIEVLPHLYEHLESFSTLREVVASRVERPQSGEVV